MIDVFLSLKTNQGKICLRKKLVYDTYNLDFKNKDEATKIKSNFYYEIEYMEWRQQTVSTDYGNQ